MSLWNSNLLSVCQMVWSVVKMTVFVLHPDRPAVMAVLNLNTTLTFTALVCSWDLFRLNFFVLQRVDVKVLETNCSFKNWRGERNNRDCEKEENQPGNMKAELNMKELVREQLYKTVKQLETKLWKVRIKQADVKVSKTTSERHIYKTAGEQQQSTHIIELLLHIGLLFKCLYFWGNIIIQFWICKWSKIQ